MVFGTVFSCLLARQKNSQKIIKKDLRDFGYPAYLMLRSPHSTWDQLCS